MSGYIFRQFKLVPHDTHIGINRWIIYLALPAVSFKYLWHLEFSSQFIAPALAPIIVLIGSWIFVSILSLIFQFDLATKGLLILAGGLCNTSFIGFPLIKTYFGEQLISIAIISDQMTFLLFASLGFMMAAFYSNSKKSSTLSQLFQVIKFPPFIASVIALALPKSIELPSLENFISQISSTVAPMALFSIGLQLQFSNWKNELGTMIPVFIYKLLLAPMLVFLFVYLGKFKTEFAQVAVFESAMPVLMSLSILCERFQLKTQIANLIIGFSIILGLISTYFWQSILIHFIP